MFHKVTKHPLGSTSFLVLYPEPKKRTQRSFSLNFYFILEDRASLVAGTVKNLPAMGGDPGLIPGLGGSPGEMQLTPVFLPGKSHGQRSPVGHSPWNCRQLSMELQRARQDWVTNTFIAD